MARLWQDVHYSLRMLLKNPGFTLIAVLTLALGIGANAAIFSMVDAVLLHPFTFPHLDQLVRVFESGPNQGVGSNPFSPADYLDLQAESRSFQQVAAFRYRIFNLTGPGEMDVVDGAAASTNFFQALGVNAAIGRTFAADEEEEGRDQVVVLSQGYWRRHYGANPNVLGKSVEMNGRKFTIVGVMPRGFNYPIGIDLWVPLSLSPRERAERTEQTLSVLGRLKPEISLEQARAEMRAFALRLEQQYPETNSGRNVTLLELRKEQYEYTAPISLMLQAAAGFVLLLACANLAYLSLSRAIGRGKEIAVRAALGADRRRLAQLFLSETVLLSILAAVAAIAVAYWGADFIRSAIPPGITKWVAGWDGVRVNGWVLGFTLLLAIGVAVVLGLGTAVQVSGVDLNRALKEGAGYHGSSHGRSRLRSGLIVSQLVLAMVTLTGAGLMMNGFLELVRVFQGFDASHVLTMQIALPESNYPNDAQAASFYKQLLDGINDLPGLESASLVTNLPASNEDDEQTYLSIEGRPALRASEVPAVDLQIVSADFLPTLRVRLLAGRALGKQDGPNTPRVAVISQSTAARFWGSGTPLGQRVKLGAPGSDSPWVTIVGVVGDVRQNWYVPRPRPTIYLPYLQAPRRVMNLMLRTAGNPISLATAAREVIGRVDAGVAPGEIQALDGVIADSLAPIRLMGILMMVFGAVALTLAAVGVYGVLAHPIAQRVHEFAIRMALGAQPGDVRKLVLGQVLKLGGIGMTVALPLSVAFSHLMGSYLFGVVALNWLILAGIASVLLLVALAAGYAPARRAMRVDPIVALRDE